MLYYDIRSADEMQDDLATVLSPERANEEKFVSSVSMMNRRVQFLSLRQHPSSIMLKQTIKNEPVTPEVEKV